MDVFVIVLLAVNLTTILVNLSTLACNSLHLKDYFKKSRTKRKKTPSKK